MAQRYFAQCRDVDSICFAVTENSGAVTTPPGRFFIEVESLDESLLRQRWNGTAFEIVEGEGEGV